MLRRSVLPASSTRIAAFAPRILTALRHQTQFVNEPSKNNPNMRHLDIYARRDPQLAPYLLREVDIEYKRRCRKVNFVFWLSICVALVLLQTRESLEVAFYLRNYTELLREELDAKDDDMDLRRAKMVGLLQLVKNVEARAAAVVEKRGGSDKLSEKERRTNHWTAADTAEVEDILRTAAVPAEQRKAAEGAREMAAIDITGRARQALWSIKG